MVYGIGIYIFSCWFWTRNGSTTIREINPSLVIKYWGVYTYVNITWSRPVPSSSPTLSHKNQNTRERSGRLNVESV